MPNEVNNPSSTEFVEDPNLELDLGDEQSSQQSTAEQQTPQQAQPSQVNLSPEALQALAAAVRPQQQEQPKEMTDEEFQKTFAYQKITPDVAKKLLPGLELTDEQVTGVASVLQEIIDGSAKHAIAVSQFLAKRQLDELNQTLTPVLKRSQTDAVTSLISAVETKVPAFKGQKAVLEMALKTLKAEGAQPRSDQEAVELLTNRAAEIMKLTNPNFSLNGSAPVQMQPAINTGGQAPSAGNSRPTSGWQSVNFSALKSKT